MQRIDERRSANEREQRSQPIVVGQDGFRFSKVHVLCVHLFERCTLKDHKRKQLIIVIVFLSIIE